MESTKNKNKKGLGLCDRVLLGQKDSNPRLERLCLWAGVLDAGRLSSQAASGCGRAGLRASIPNEA